MARRKVKEGPNVRCRECGWQGQHTEVEVIHEESPYPGYKLTRVACPQCHVQALEYAPWTS